jgi:hypothetical protein
VHDEGKAEVERERETDEELDVAEEVEDLIKAEEEDILRCLVRKGKSMAPERGSDCWKGVRAKDQSAGQRLLVGLLECLIVMLRGRRQLPACPLSNQLGAAGFLEGVVHPTEATYTSNRTRRQPLTPKSWRRLCQARQCQRSS